MNSNDDGKVTWTDYILIVISIVIVALVLLPTS